MSKNDLVFSTPFLNAAGMLGLAPDVRATLDPFPQQSWEGLGAFVTNPLSMRPRRLTTHTGLVQYPGGMLLHTGLPNPGFFEVVRKYGRRWENSDLPVIVHLMADAPGDVRSMVQVLERYENICAVELGFAPLCPPEDVLAAVGQAGGELAIIASLSFEQALTLGPQVIRRGASAISFAPPRGVLPVDGGFSSGRLYGPGLFPQSLGLLKSAVRLGLPVIAGVGVYRLEHARAMLEAGALAVQLDAVLWK